ncbi:entericidin A/B family lipoprotein [Modicisalibacter radicis]|nr:entericidin A/B family lipoprotein [Halomonas sp. EAR18]
MKGSLMVVALLLLIALAGCNTMEGLGKDVEKVGSEIEEAAG